MLVYFQNSLLRERWWGCSEPILFGARLLFIDFLEVLGREGAGRLLSKFPGLFSCACGDPTYIGVFPMKNWLRSPGSLRVDCARLASDPYRCTHHLGAQEEIAVVVARLLAHRGGRRISQDQRPSPYFYHNRTWANLGLSVTGLRHAMFADATLMVDNEISCVCDPHIPLA